MSLDKWHYVVVFFGGWGSIMWSFCCQLCFVVLFLCYTPCALCGREQQEVCVCVSLFKFMCCLLCLVMLARSLKYTQSSFSATPIHHSPRANEHCSSPVLYGDVSGRLCVTVGSYTRATTACCTRSNCRRAQLEEYFQALVSTSLNSPCE